MALLRRAQRIHGSAQPTQVDHGGRQSVSNPSRFAELERAFHAHETTEDLRDVLALLRLVQDVV
jgi:hypothetical protein